MERSRLLIELGGITYTKDAYPERVLSNLEAWGRFTKAKPAFAFTSLPLDLAFGFPEFRELSEFEKCWVIDAQKTTAFRDYSVDALERLPRFEKAVKENPDAFKVYQKYFVMKP